MINLIYWKMYLWGTLNPLSLCEKCILFAGCWWMWMCLVTKSSYSILNIEFNLRLGWAGLGRAGPFILQLCWRALLLLLLLEPGGGLKQLEQHFNSLSQDGQARAGTGCWVSTSQFALDCLKQQRGGLGRIHENRTRTGYRGHYSYLNTRMSTILERIVR